MDLQINNSRFAAKKAAEQKYPLEKYTIRGKMYIILNKPVVIQTFQTLMVALSIHIFQKTPPLSTSFKDQFRRSVMFNDGAQRCKLYRTQCV